MGLDPAQDAYWEILLAVLEGRRACGIVEREDGLIWCGDPAGHDLPELRSHDGRAARIRVRWRDRASPWFHYLLVPPDEMRALVEGAGWSVARVFEDGTPRYVVELTPGEEGRAAGAPAAPLRHGRPATWCRAPRAAWRGWDAPRWRGRPRSWASWRPTP